MNRILYSLSFLMLAGAGPLVAEDLQPPADLEAYFEPPAEYSDNLTTTRSPLRFEDGTEVKSAQDWDRRRNEILGIWRGYMGEWPPVLERPEMAVLESISRENFLQKRIKLQIAPGQHAEGYLLVPLGKGPFPAVYVPFYDPETSIGLGKKPLRDFAFQLAKRGFVTLSMGAPGGDARLPVLSQGAKCQPLSYLGYLSANAWQALASLPEVDSARIGIVGHSYGGKWAMFGSCLWEKFACAVWSDPGVAFDETRPSVNYWEPWYLGLDSANPRKPGLISAESPRRGAYQKLVEGGHDLQELQALMAPRPFLVSGGSEDYPARWATLNHAIRVNRVLGAKHRVGMQNREKHDPTEFSNEVIYRFFEWTLKPDGEGRN